MWKLTPKPGFQAGSSTEGFFQERPRIPNQVHEDRGFDRIRKRKSICFHSAFLKPRPNHSVVYLPSAINSEIAPELDAFGSLALSKQILTWIADAEKNLPYLETYNTFGQRQDRLVCSEGWRQLQNTTIAEGIVATPYENKHGEFSRVHQFLKYHLWSGSNANVTCPSAMSDGAASFITRHLQSMSADDPKRAIIQAAYDRLISRNPEEAWTSGQWMTERPGGSDVTFSETVAVPAQEPMLGVTDAHGAPLGDWSVDGFKWFSSATDADMSILLARTPEGKLSTFFAPMRRTLHKSHPMQKGMKETATELNGVRVMQLKRKLGTKPLPTAELELKDMRAYLLGDAGNGIREISTILNITRVHNSVTSVATWARGLAIKRAFARVRKVAGGQPLWKMSSHVAVMAQDEVSYRGWMNFAFFTVLLLGISEQASRFGKTSDLAPGIDRALVPELKDVENLLRVLTPVLKAGSAKACIAGLQECVEGLGGVGFCENEEQDLNVARLYRDSNVLSIWEGTTETLSWDLIKIVKGRKGADVLASLDRWIQAAKPSSTVLHMWLAWMTSVKNKKEETLLLDGREVLLELAKIVGAVLLEIDARRDDDEIVKEIARRWVAGKQDWKTAEPVGRTTAMNMRIVWGEHAADAWAKL